MEEKKRKTTTSTAVKSRYNDRVYDKIAFRVSKELSEKFKAKCAAEGISPAQIFKKAMEEFLEH